MIHVFQGRNRMRYFLLLLITNILSFKVIAEQKNIIFLEKYHEGSFIQQSFRLALEKSKDQYGDYSITYVAGMNSIRSVQVMSERRYQNAVRLITIDKKFNRYENLSYAKFPVMLGVWAYRVCFTSDKTLNKLKTINTIDGLRKFKHGQGRGWYDVEALRNNGFEVLDVGDEAFHGNIIDSLYQMVAMGRVDLFCRSISEAYTEYQNYKHVKGLVLEPNFAIYYPFPVVFYTNNPAVSERLTYGLVTAYNDGSYHKLWHRHFDKDIDYAQLNKRKIFKLNKNNFKWLDFDYQQYLYKPDFY